MPQACAEPDGNSRSFQFHAALNSDVTQGDVISKCGVRQLLDAAFMGYASSVIAYGQTGSGKTFTMTGREEMIERATYARERTWDDNAAPDGLLSRSLAHLYSKIAKLAASGARQTKSKQNPNDIRHLHSLLK